MKRLALAGLAAAVAGAGAGAAARDRADLDVGRDTTIAADAAYAGGRIRAGATLRLDPARSLTLTFTSNVIVDGALVSRPNPGVTHTIRFEGVNEAGYVGGGMTPLASDVGLWVIGEGRLDLAGAEKRSWTRLAGGVARGATTIELDADADGWQPGDTIVIAPTTRPTDAAFWAGFDEAQIARVDGRRVSLTAPLSYDHPRVGERWTAEVFVLSRSMVLEGTPRGRAHVFIHSSGPQSIANVEIRHMGPFNARDPEATVLGRYPLHFHHAGDGSRGSTVRGVVVHHSGNRAFVTHGSNGVTYLGTVAYDVVETPYWWDPAPRGTQRKLRDASNDSDGVTYDRAIAALVRPTVAFRGYRLAGFQVASGTNLTLIDSVAVGVQGNKSSSGFHWPEGQSASPWIFERNLAHNNKRDGIFVWQNTPIRHRISDFTAYHNGGAGIEHGAYGNAYLYERLTLFGNREAGIHLHAVGKEQAGGLRFRCGEIDGAGIGAAGALISPSPVSGDPARFEGISIRSTQGPDFQLHGRAAGRGMTIDQRVRQQAADCVTSAPGR
jgi:hypothetical protein